MSMSNSNHCQSIIYCQFAPSPWLIDRVPDPISYLTNTVLITHTPCLLGVLTEGLVYVRSLTMSVLSRICIWGDFHENHNNSPRWKFWSQLPCFTNSQLIYYYLFLIKTVIDCCLYLHTANPAISLAGELWPSSGRRMSLPNNLMLMYWRRAYLWSFRGYRGVPQGTGIGPV